MTNDQIKKIALAHGFKLKVQADDSVDLNPYVYEFAREIASSVKPELKRMWINQPSTLQLCHKLHGTNVLAYHEYGDTWRIYFLDGRVESQQISSSALSDGWLEFCKN